MIKLKNRKKSVLILTVFISLAIFVNLNTLNYANEDSLPTKNDTTIQEDDFSVRSSAPLDPKPWTMIVYNAADSNLDGINNLPDGIGSDDDLNVVYLDDGASDGDSQACYITYNGSPEDIPLSDISPSWTNEVNMGDPGTLLSFSKFCIDNYPADQYLVILRDHGAAWLGCCEDLSCEEYEDLDLDELEVAFKEINKHIGHNIDVLHFDACLMSNMEVAAQLYPYVDYIVGSETSAWASTWDNGEKIIEEIREDHFYGDSRGLAIRIADIARIKDDPSYLTQSISVIDCAQVGDLVYDVNLLAIELINILDTNRSYIKYIRSILHSFFLPKLVDLYDFCEKLSSFNGIIQDYALNVMSDIEAVIIKDIQTISAAFCHGLSINFPEFIHEMSSAYQGYLYFCTATMWDEFIEYFITGEIPVDNENPTWIIEPYDITLDYGFSLKHDIDAIDNVRIDHYWIEDDIHFTMDSDGTITNKTDLSLGTYSITVRAYDPSDNYCEKTFTLTIADFTAHFTVSRTEIKVGDTVSFRFTADPVRDPTSFSWGFGDGYTSNVENPTHTYNTVGIHSVVLLVHFDNGKPLFNEKEDLVIVNDIPIITPPNDISYIIGTKGNKISWNVTDTISDNREYEVFIDGDQYGSPGTWSTGSAFEIDVDGLKIGIYNFTIKINDGYGGFISDEVMVEVKKGPFMPVTPYIVVAMIVALVGVGIIINRKIKR